MTQLETPPPRFATARNPAYRSNGWRVRKVARALGTPLIPWQDYVIDVASELDPFGRYRYHTVVVTVPRQSGKTTLVLANGVDRCLFLPNAKVWHTAQTGQDAREKWLEMADPFAKTTMGKVAGILRRGAGSTRFTFANGSLYRPHPPTEDALHGQQSDLNNIDEGWAFDDAQGQALEQAILPTQATRPGAQTWITSTMGTADSTWFHAICDKGRALATEGGDAGIAYFEWSIGDDVDPMDLEAVAAAHPAYGHLIDMQALERAAEKMQDTPAAFARAYGNRRTSAAERVIPVEAWLRAQGDTPIPESADVTIAAATSWTRDETSIVAAGIVDGLPVVEVLACRPGTAWAVDAIESVCDAQNAPVVIDPVGPSGPLADAVSLRHGVNLIRAKTSEVTSAAADLFDRVTDVPPRIRFRPDAAMNAAVDRASRRLIGDGAWTWGRRTSSGSIATLEAGTLAAYWCARTVPAAAPYIYTGA